MATVRAPVLPASGSRPRCAGRPQAPRGAPPTSRRAARKSSNSARHPPPALRSRTSSDEKPGPIADEQPSRAGRPVPLRDRRPQHEERRCARDVPHVAQTPPREVELSMREVQRVGQNAQDLRTPGMADPGANVRHVRGRARRETRRRSGRRCPARASARPATDTTEEACRADVPSHRRLGVRIENAAGGEDSRTVEPHRSSALGTDAHDRRGAVCEQTAGDQVRGGAIRLAER